MARVLDKNTVISELKAGNEITGDRLWGYRIHGGRYDGWTVRADTVVNWLKQDLLSQEHDKISHYYHYRWID